MEILWLVPLFFGYLLGFFSPLWREEYKEIKRIHNESRIISKEITKFCNDYKEFDIDDISDASDDVASFKGKLDNLEKQSRKYGYLSDELQELILTLKDLEHISSNTPAFIMDSKEYVSRNRRGHIGAFVSKIGDLQDL